MEPGRNADGTESFSEWEKLWANRKRLEFQKNQTWGRFQVPKKVLLALAALAVVLAAILSFCWPRNPVPEVNPSYDGDPASHDGDKTLLVAIYADWASVWKATADVLAKVDRTKYDIKLIEADGNREAVRKLGVDIVPTVIVYRDGKEIARLPNMMSADQLP
jgi:hypothetical protein